VSIKGSPYARFQRSLQTRNLAAYRSCWRPLRHRAGGTAAAVLRDAAAPRTSAL